MNKQLILALFMVFSSAHLVAQSDTLNQVDSDGKKTGWWLTYLDKNFEVLQDSSGATHCMYNYYWRNKFLYRFGEGYGSKKHPVLFPENDSLRKGNFILLNGVYKTMHENGNVRSVLSASNGILIDFKTYYPNGQIKLKVTYSKDCGAPKQHCLREYKKDGRIKYDGHTWLPEKAK